jgi:hypothetical protein
MSWRKFEWSQTGQRQRMQGLQHQRADAADQHAAEIAVHRQLIESGPNSPGSPLGFSRSS